MSWAWRSTAVAWASARTSSMLALQGTIAKSPRSRRARLVSVLLPGPSATTKSACSAEHRQLVEDLVGGVERRGADLRGRLGDPFGRGSLGVAIGEDDRMALLVQPRRQMDRQRRLADAALGICDDDDHAGMYRGKPVRPASRTFRKAHGRTAGGLGRHVGQSQCLPSCATRPASKAEGRKLIRPAGKHRGFLPAKQSCKHEILTERKLAVWLSWLPTSQRAGRSPFRPAGRARVIVRTCRSSILPAVQPAKAANEAGINIAGTAEDSRDFCRKGRGCGFFPGTRLAWALNHLLRSKQTCMIGCPAAARSGQDAGGADRS